MSQVEFNDHDTKWLVKLGNLGVQGLTNQALNKGGAKAHKALVARANKAGSHKYNMRFNDRHQRVLTYGEKSKRAYSRQDLSSGHSLQVGIGDLARFKLYAHSSVMLVGFLNTKSYTSYKFRAGVESKGKRVKGTQTKAIADRLAKGGREELTDEKKRLFRRSGWSKAAKRGYVMKKARPIINTSEMVSIAEEVAKKEFFEALKQFEKKER